MQKLLLARPCLEARMLVELHSSINSKTKGKRRNSKMPMMSMMPFCIDPVGS